MKISLILYLPKIMTFLLYIIVIWGSLPLLLITCILFLPFIVIAISRDYKVTKLKACKLYLKEFWFLIKDCSSRAFWKEKWQYISNIFDKL